MSNDRAIHAANRFGLGASRDIVAAIGADPRGWLRAQIGANVNDTGPSTPPAKTSLTEYLTATMERRRKRRQADHGDEALAALEREQREFRRMTRRQVAAETTDRLTYAVATATPFRERLVHFWSNHFTVSRQGKPQLASACVGFENEAIRHHMNGHFTDLLIGVIGHPVMLVYLDNAQSIGPNSPVGRRRRVGLNENLAREVLELHTLGVAGGYSQSDVTALAAILTGWTVGNERLRRINAESGAFVFVPMMHEPGRPKLLGRTYAEAGVEQGIAALTELSRHPATAAHMARKLARHFVADAPGEAAVTAIEQAWLRSDGHLPTVHAALIDLDAAWRADSAKLRTPTEYVVAAIRAVAADVPVASTRLTRAASPALRLMGHVPFSAPSPAGWPDTATHWSAPAALKQRIDWGVEVGRRLGNAVDARETTHWIVSPTATELAETVSGAESRSQALALLLASPAMQWR